jgi:Zn-dependent peptidase ImmA (M78 family)
MPSVKQGKEDVNPNAAVEGVKRYCGIMFQVAFASSGALVDLMNAGTCSGNCSISYFYFSYVPRFPRMSVGLWKIKALWWYSYPALRSNFLFLRLIERKKSMFSSAAAPALIKPNYRRAEREAIKLLNQCGIENPPVNPIEIAEGILNVPVRFATFRADESERISGFYDSEDNAIVVNREEFPLRQTFTIAHEMGHKVLHEEWARSSEYQVLLRNPKDRNRDFREREADAFAANLLMPRFMMDGYYETLSISDLSRLFAVSVPAIQARLSFLYGI